MAESQTCVPLMRTATRGNGTIRGRRQEAAFSSEDIPTLPRGLSEMVIGSVRFTAGLVSRVPRAVKQFAYSSSIIVVVLNRTSPFTQTPKIATW